MIDTATESLLTPDEARRQIPGRKGKQLDLCTLYRWMQRGRKGVRLEYVCLSRKQYTSKEALARYFQRSPRPPKPKRSRPPRRPASRSPLSPSVRHRQTAGRESRRPPDGAWPAGPNRPDAPGPWQQVDPCKKALNGLTEAAAAEDAATAQKATKAAAAAASSLGPI